MKLKKEDDNPFKKLKTQWRSRVSLAEKPVEFFDNSLIYALVKILYQVHHKGWKKEDFEAELLNSILRLYLTMADLAEVEPEKIALMLKEVSKSIAKKKEGK